MSSSGRTLVGKGNTKSSLNDPYNSSLIPYALKWTEHEMELRPVRPLKSSGKSGKTPSVFPRWGHACTAIPNSAGEYIIFGGKVKPDKEEVWTNDVILLSTVDMSLTSLETSGEKPRVKSSHRTVIAGRVLVVFGGSADSFLHFLSLNTREWSKLRPPAPYPDPRYGHSFTLVNNTVWLYGGVINVSILEDMWCLDLAAEGLEYVRWRRVPQKEPSPKARGYHSTVAYDGCLYLFGGQVYKDDASKGQANDLWKFEIRTETWTKIECSGTPPQTRNGHAAAVIGDNMFVFGGLIEGAKPGEFLRTDHAFAFNFRDCTWRSLAMLGCSPGLMNTGGLLAHDSRLILMGGQFERAQCVHVAEIRAAGDVRESLAKLEFTTETTNFKFTTEVVDLSRFVRKQGNSAHSLAGFSDVWKGEMTETEQPIAIKILRVTSTGNPDDPETVRLRTRFDRELAIWMECQHPRVLELLGYAYIEGIPCLISPWCSNGNILEYLTKNPDADRRRLINQVAEGLVYLHGREPPVVHADIKPANVLVSDEGDAKLCDFGISKLVLESSSGFTTTASVKGTLRYSSPEILDLDGQTTTTSDVWAFGMLILHVMTNRLPYIELVSDAKIIMAIMSGQRPIPAHYPELPSTDTFWDRMSECWRDDPTERPTMTEVLDKLST